MSWTLEHASTTQSLSAWGLSNCVLSESSLSSAVLTARWDGNALATVPFAWLDQVILRNGSTIVFIGFAMPAKRVHDGSNETIELRFENAWWYLSQGFFQTPVWDTGVSSAIVSTRAVLFASVVPGTGWSGLGMEAQLTAIISAANTWHGGSKMQFGTVTGDFDLQPPPQEEQSQTFEQALRNALLWVPDAVQRWDYTTTPPTVSFVRRGNATARTRAHSLSSGSDFVPRHEDLLRGVRIVWLSKDEEGNLLTTVDAAGETSGVGIAQTTITIDDDRQPVQTVPGQTESQFVRSISTDDALDIDGDRPNPSEEWFFEHGGLSKIVADVADMVVLHPGNAASVSGLTAGPFLGLAPTLTLDPDAPENDGYASLGSNTRWLIEGDIPKWLTRGSHLRVGILKAEILTRVLPPGSTRYVFNIEQVNLRMRLTDLGSSAGTTYTNILTADTIIGGGAGTVEAVTGIAAVVLAGRGVLHHAGSWRTEGEECDLDLRCGDVLNLTGGLTAWETMNAHISAVTHDLERGVTTVACGPPEHLSIQDLIAVFKRINPATWISQQAGGPET